MAQRQYRSIKLLLERLFQDRDLFLDIFLTHDRYFLRYAVSMRDLIFSAAVVFLCVITWGFIIICQRLMGS